MLSLKPAVSRPQTMTESGGRSLPIGSAESDGSMKIPSLFPRGMTNVAPASTPASVFGAMTPVNPPKMPMFGFSQYE
jgi:hypothetical protein